MNNRFNLRTLPIFIAFMILLVNLFSAYSASASPKSAVKSQHLSIPGSATNLTFQNDEVELSGSLILPAEDGPFPAVVMIHGSAPDTRKVFLETGDATAFLDAGLAVFIYDKRGTGDSGGDSRTASLEDLADDAIAAVRLIKLQPGIDPQAVGVFGVSQGGTVGALAASRSDDVDFVINVSGSATPLANQEMWSVGNELRGRGFSEESLELTMKGYHLLFSARGLVRRGILPLEDLWFVAKDPYLDPADYWPEIDQPMFVAYGALDKVMPSATSVEIALPILESGHPFNRLYIYSDAGHGIRRGSGEWSDRHIEAMTVWTRAIASGKTPAPQPNILVEEIDSGSNRWYGMGNLDTPWYNHAIFQLPVILIFSIVSLFSLFLALLPSTNLSPTKYRVPARLMLGLSGLVNLSLVFGFLARINFVLNADPEGFTPPLPLTNWLPLLSATSLLTMVALAVITLKVVQQEGGSRFMRGFYSLATMNAAGYVLFLAHWGLI